MPRTRIIGFAPDMDPTTPGVLTDCAAVLPSIRGMRMAPGATPTGIAALSAACVGAAALRSVDDSLSIFAGTATGLYKASGLSWTDVSRTVGGAYAVAAGYHWSFAQFGNVSLATNDADKLQFLTSSGSDFENVTAAPKAAFVEVVGQFVFLADTNDGVNIEHDRWWCSASGDYTDWTPSIVTECAKGRLVSSPGPILGLKKFGEQIIAYKARSMFIGTYVGAPEIWRFQEVPAQIGAVSERAVANIGTDAYPKHIFMGADDIYVFDGSRPTPIGAGFVREYIYNSIEASRLRNCIATHDPVNSLVYFYYHTTDSANLNACVVYNYKTNRWGVDDRTIECAFEYSTPGITYDDLGTYYATYADLPNVSYDAAFFAADARSIGVFDASHVLSLLTSTSVTSHFTTGDMGEEANFSVLSRVRPLYLTAPTTAQMTNYYRNNLGESLTTDATTTYASGKFDLLRSARWHRLKFTMTGNWEQAEMNVYASTEGEQ